jgi:hypothetical protein
MLVFRVQLMHMHGQLGVATASRAFQPMLHGVILLVHVLAISLFSGFDLF